MYITISNGINIRFISLESVIGEALGTLFARISFWPSLRSGKADLKIKKEGHKVSHLLDMGRISSNLFL